MALTPFETLTGSLSLTIVIISSIIGLKIVSKYFKLKQRQLLLVGLTWILLCEIWWSSAFSFLVALFTGEALSEEVYFSLGNFLVPVALLIWLTAFTDFMYQKKKKIILSITGITGVLYYIVFFYFIFVDVSVIGVMFNAVDAEYRSFALIYLISVLFTFLTTGLMFAIKSLKSDNPEIKLKGKFLFLAVVSFTIGAALDGLKPFLFEEILNAVLIINRIILVTSALEFYTGFMLPRWIKELILRNEKV